MFMRITAIATIKSLKDRFTILLTNWSKRLYGIIFKEQMTEDAETFLKNLLFVGIGTSVSTLLSTIFLILGGRLLGPNEYGKFILIQSVVNFLYLPMLFGFNIGVLKYTSEKSDLHYQFNVLAISYIGVFLLTILSIAIYVKFSSVFSHFFGISPDLFYTAIVFAVLYTFYTLTASALRGLNRMKAYSIFQIVYAVILLFSFSYFIIIKQLSFRAMVYPMLLAYGITTITIIIFIQRIVGIFKRIFDITLAKMLGKYAVATFIGGSSYIIYTNIDRIMLARYRSLSEVGFYSAYYAGSINIAMLIWGMFILVFFPTVSRYKNKGPVFKKINRVIPYLVVLGILSLLVCEFIVLKFYGKQYQLNIISMLLFAVTSIFMVIQGTYASLLNSIGTRGAIISSLTAIIAALVNIGLNLVLIPAFGINGAIISLMTSYSAALIVILLFGRKHLRDDKLITIGE